MTEEQRHSPSAAGLLHHPPDGVFVDRYGVGHVCTCRDDCPEICTGDCGCPACKADFAVWDRAGLTYSEDSGLWSDQVDHDQ